MVAGLMERTLEIVILCFPETCHYGLERKCEYTTLEKADITTETTLQQIRESKE